MCSNVTSLGRQAPPHTTSQGPLPSQRPPRLESPLTSFLGVCICSCAHPLPKGRPAGGDSGAPQATPGLQANPSSSSPTSLSEDIFTPHSRPENPGLFPPLSPPASPSWSFRAFPMADLWFEHWGNVSMMPSGSLCPPFLSGGSSLATFHVPMFLPWTDRLEVFCLIRGQLDRPLFPRAAAGTPGHRTERSASGPLPCFLLSPASSLSSLTRLPHGRSRSVYGRSRSVYVTASSPHLASLGLPGLTPSPCSQLRHQPPHSRIVCGPPLRPRSSWAGGKNE